jgi:hypothetical protein
MVVDEARRENMEQNIEFIDWWGDQLRTSVRLIAGPGNEPSFIFIYPLVNIQKTMEHHHLQWEKSTINGHFPLLC